jgi:hypothetical protein
MIYVRSGDDALSKRAEVISPGSGQRHWGTVFFGPRSSAARAPGPQATMSDLVPGETILPHFHGVSMFQLFLDGSGTVGNKGQPLKPLTVQFKDHHTAYGPIVAGPQGLSFVALRIITANSEPVYLHREGYRERLKPSRRRNLMSEPVVFSVEPVRQFREQPVWEDLLAETDDGMFARIARVGAGQQVAAPDPRAAGGYYVFVGAGSLLHGAEELPRWSMVVVENTEESFTIAAGPRGVEALVLQYPRGDIE